MRFLGLVVVCAVLWYLLKGKIQEALTTIGPEPWSEGPGGSPVASPLASGGGSRLEDFAEAVSRMEGTGPNSIATKNNNPGNLRSGPNQAGTANGFAVYADSGDGWGDLNDLISKRTAAHPDWDFYDWFDYYLRGSTIKPSVDAQGNSDQYAEYVANYGGWDPLQTVSSALGS